MESPCQLNLMPFLAVVAVAAIAFLVFWSFTQFGDEIGHMAAAAQRQARNLARGIDSSGGAAPSCRHRGSGGARRCRPNLGANADGGGHTGGNPCGRRRCWSRRTSRRRRRADSATNRNRGSAKSAGAAPYADTARTRANRSPS